MQIIRTIKKLRNEIKKTKLKDKTIGFVPTMGALHPGHLTLIRQARRENDIVVVSIFVNPMQFGPREDFRRYPRPIRKDIASCGKEKVDFIFYPKAKDLYPQGFKTFVTVEQLSNVLCGKTRAGHFRGVATVVTKLFNIVNPDTAYFGQKDAQQAIIIKRMVEDLNIPVKIKVMPTVRQNDGLALSSRNVYLNQQERKDALVLSRSLNLAKDLLKEGQRNAGRVINAMRKLIQQRKSAKIDYISIVEPKDLKPVKRIFKGCLIALAVWIGKTRLIDNIIVNC
jgi:pantoate--beta-alanine ligase